MYQPCMHIAPHLCARSTSAGSQNAKVGVRNVGGRNTCGELGGGGRPSLDRSAREGVSLAGHPIQPGGGLVNLHVGYISYTNYMFGALMNNMIETTAGHPYTRQTTLTIPNRGTYCDTVSKNGAQYISIRCN